MTWKLTRGELRDIIYLAPEKAEPVARQGRKATDLRNTR